MRARRRSSFMGFLSQEPRGSPQHAIRRNDAAGEITASAHNLIARERSGENASGIVRLEWQRAPASTPTLVEQATAETRHRRQPRARLVAADSRLDGGDQPHAAVEPNPLGSFVRSECCSELL